MGAPDLRVVAGAADGVAVGGHRQRTGASHGLGLEAASDLIDLAQVLVHHEFDAGEAAHVAWSGISPGRAVRLTTEDGDTWQVDDCSVPRWAALLAEQLGAAHAALADDIEDEPSPLPAALAVDSDLLLASADAVYQGRSDLLHELAEAFNVRARRASLWQVVPVAERVRMLHHLHDQVRGHFRLAAMDRGTGETRSIAWMLHRDGWRELSGGVPGVVHLRRHDPAVLADRLAAALGGVR